MRSGFVGLIGRPNVGKSTLMNSIIGRKIAITSNKPQTTRNMIQGIYHAEGLQIVFVDTPGIHKPTHKLGKYLNREAYYSMNDVDVILMLVNVEETFGAGDQYIIDKLKEIDKPVILVMNKIDRIPKEQILLKISEYQEKYPFQEFVPVSALKKDNVDTLIKVIEKYLTDEIPYFEEHQITNKGIDFVFAELVREKVFQLTEEEVPHSVTCVVEQIEKGKQTYTVHVAVIVDRESLKKIIIGKQGSKLKEIGTKARQEMEEWLGKKVYLNLFVKTIPKWRDKEKYLSEFGFNDFEN